MSEQPSHSFSEKRTESSEARHEIQDNEPSNIPRNDSPTTCASVIKIAMPRKLTYAAFQYGLPSKHDAGIFSLLAIRIYVRVVCL